MAWASKDSSGLGQPALREGSWWAEPVYPQDLSPAEVNGYEPGWGPRRWMGSWPLPQLLLWQQGPCLSLSICSWVLPGIYWESLECIFPLLDRWTILELRGMAMQSRKGNVWRHWGLETSWVLTLSFLFSCPLPSHCVSISCILLICATHCTHPGKILDWEWVVGQFTLNQCRGVITLSRTWRPFWWGWRQGLGAQGQASSCPFISGPGFCFLAPSFLCSFIRGGMASD